MSDTAQARNVDSTEHAAGEPQLHVNEVPQPLMTISHALSEIADDLQRLAARDAESTAAYLVSSAATTMRTAAQTLADGTQQDQAATQLAAALAWCGTPLGRPADSTTVDVRESDAGTPGSDESDLGGTSGSASDPNAESATHLVASSDSGRHVAAPHDLDSEQLTTFETPHPVTGDDEAVTSSAGMAATKIAAAGAAAAAAGVFVAAASDDHDDEHAVIDSSADSAATSLVDEQPRDSWQALQSEPVASAAAETVATGPDTDVTVDQLETSHGLADTSDAELADSNVTSSDAQYSCDSADRLAAVTNSHTLVREHITDDESGMVIDEADEADATELRAYEEAFGPASESGFASDSGAQAGALAAALERGSQQAPQSYVVDSEFPTADSTGSESLADDVHNETDVQQGGAEQPVSDVTAETDAAFTADAEVSEGSGLSTPTRHNAAAASVALAGATLDTPVGQVVSDDVELADQAPAAAVEVSDQAALRDVDVEVAPIPETQPMPEGFVPGATVEEVPSAGELGETVDLDSSWLQDTVDIQALAKNNPDNEQIVEAAAEVGYIDIDGQTAPMAAPSGEPVAQSFALPPREAHFARNASDDNATTEPGASAYEIAASQQTQQVPDTPDQAETQLQGDSRSDVANVEEPDVAATVQQSVFETATGMTAEQHIEGDDSPTIDNHVPQTYDQSRPTDVLPDPGSAVVFGDSKTTRIMTPPEAKSLDFDNLDDSTAAPVPGLGQETIPMSTPPEQFYAEQQWQHQPTQAMMPPTPGTTRQLQEGHHAATVQSAVPESTWMNSDTIDHKSFQAQAGQQGHGDDTPTMAIPTNYQPAAATPEAADHEPYEEDQPTTVTPPAVVEQLKQARKAAEAEDAKRPRGNLPWGSAPGQ